MFQHQGYQSQKSQIIADFADTIVPTLLGYDILPVNLEKTNHKSFLKYLKK